MFSYDKVQRGIAKYLDTELIPKLEGKDKWVVSGMAALMLNKIPQMANELSKNEMIKISGIVANEAIDVEAIIKAIKPAARQSPATFQIPLGGTITLTEADLDMIYNNILQS